MANGVFCCCCYCNLIPCTVNFWGLRTNKKLQYQIHKKKQVRAKYLGATAFHGINKARQFKLIHFYIFTVRYTSNIISIRSWYLNMAPYHLWDHHTHLIIDLLESFWYNDFFKTCSVSRTLNQLTLPTLQLRRWTIGATYLSFVAGGCSTLLNW